MPHRPLVNRQAVRAKFASAGYRTFREVLDYLDAIVEAATPTAFSSYFL